MKLFTVYCDLHISWAILLGNRCRNLLKHAQTNMQIQLRRQKQGLHKSDEPQSQYLTSPPFFNTLLAKLCDFFRWSSPAPPQSLHPVLPTSSQPSKIQPTVPQINSIVFSPVHPLRFSLLTSAPCCSRTLAQSRWPSVTARWRGVRPRGSKDSKSVWIERRSRRKGERCRRTIRDI